VAQRFQPGAAAALAPVSERNLWGFLGRVSPEKRGALLNQTGDSIMKNGAINSK